MHLKLTNIRRYSLLGAWALFGCLPLLSYAELEMGLGMSAVHVPHYIGSDEAEDFYLPFPYLRYRSEKISIDRNLIQANLWRAGKWSLEISLGGAVKVDSDKNEARQGMSDLDFIIEAGPAIHYYFQGDRKQENSLYFELPLRGAISTDFIAADYRGYTFNPRVVWRRGYQMGLYEVRPQLTVGVRSASSHYHDYTYGVKAEDVTAQRQEYKAQSGYGGFQLGYSTAVLWSDWLVAGFFRYVNISGATFEDSPLVKKENSVLVGVASAYLF